MAFHGRCYCGHTRLQMKDAPREVAYCHCKDCRRWTGGAVGAFAAFGAVTASPDLGDGRSFTPGVTRWVCPECGSPLMAQFEYLPGQVYVPLGVIEEADQLQPRVHCHEDKRLSWLHIQDDARRIEGSARGHLNAAAEGS